MNINRNRDSYLNRISILPEVYETQQQHTLDRFDGEKTYYSNRSYNSTRKNRRSNCLNGKTVLQIVVEQKERLSREERDLARIDIESLRKRATLGVQRDEISKQNQSTKQEHAITKFKCDQLFAMFEDFFQKLAELQEEMCIEPSISYDVDQPQTRKPRKRVSWRLDLNECVLIEERSKYGGHLQN